MHLSTTALSNLSRKPFFATALYTGMRKGELFALQKADVDFDAALIRASRPRSTGTSPPATSRRRSTVSG
jgi:integrase